MQAVINPLKNIGLPQAEGVIKTLWHRSPILTASGTVMLALMLPTLALLLLDSRTINDVNVWLKPLKFQLSLGTYFLTLAWFVGYSSKAFFHSKQRLGFEYILATAAWFELTYITVQGALGEMSHFNVGDAFHGLMYSLMGIGAVTLTTAPLWLAASIQNNREQTLPPALKMSVVSGFVLTCLLGLISGSTISAFNGPLIGESSQAATSLWLLGWSFQQGDLRVAHFIGLHLLQLLPITAYFLIKTNARFVNFWVGVTIFLFTSLWTISYIQALLGIPFWSLGF